MPYNTVVNIIFVISVVGAIVLVLRRLPEATGAVQEEKKIATEQIEAPRKALLQKGIPAQAFSKSKAFILEWTHKIWQFLLEAKGIKQAPKISYGFKKILRTAHEPETKPAVIKNEKYYLGLIKRNPKDKSYYDLLGQFYFEAKKYDDATNVYEYLVQHTPTDASYWAKLGLSNLYLKRYEKSQEAYEKAIELDATTPSRFYNLALSLQGLRDYRGAVDALKQAIHLEPNNNKYNDLLFEMESKARISVPVENIHKKE